MGKSYLNIVVDKEISIGVEQLLIAPFPTAWTPTKIFDPELVPPSGFRNLGTVVEDSVTMSLTREKFQLRTGIPKNLQYEAIMGVTGILEASLIARRGTLAYFGLGGLPPAAPLPVAIFQVMSVLSQSVIVCSSMPPAWITSLQVGMLFTAGESSSPAPNDELNIINDAYLIEWEELVPFPDGITFTFSPGFPNTVVPGDVIYDQDYQQQPFGSNRITKFHLLGVADFIDGVQIIHDFPEVTASGEWTEEFRPDQEARIPVKFEAQGFTTTTYDSSVSHLTVGERFWFSETP